MAAIIYLKELSKSLSKVTRENENSMVQKLINIAQNSRFAKNAPETQVQSVNNQLRQVGMGTMYVDAASAAETENGQAALNQLVQDGIVSEQELNDSITKGTQLEISPGAYFQTVTEENANVISEYSTFDKGGKTLAAIKESRARAQKFLNLVNEFKEKKESADINSIVEENFTDPKEKEEMLGLLPGNLENIPKAVNDKIEEVKAQIADLTGAQSKIDYIRGKNKKKSSSDVVVAENATTTTNAAEAENIPKNAAENTEAVPATQEATPVADEAWYTDFKTNNKKAPTIRDAYDIAYNEALEEANKAGTDEAKATAQQLTTLMERLHTLEGLKEKVAALDIDDIKARTLLDEEAYKKVYLPVKEILKNGPQDVRESAQESAIILSRVIQTFSQTYGESYENVAKVYLGVDVSNAAFNMPANNDVDPNMEVNVVDLTSYIPETVIDDKEIRRYVKDILRNKLSVETVDGKAHLVGPRNRDKSDHFADSSNFKNLHMQRNKRKQIIRQAAIYDIEELAKNAVLIESSPNSKVDKKENIVNYHYFFVPFKINTKNGERLYVTRIIAEEAKEYLGLVPLKAELYDLFIEEKKSISAAEPATSASVVPAGDAPSRLTILQMLEGVNDHAQKPFINKNGTLNKAYNLKLNEAPNKEKGKDSSDSDNKNAEKQNKESEIKSEIKENSKDEEVESQEKLEYDQTVWHGSPFSFERFDLGKIGSGEGAQAHGWGLYFAEDRKVSENYKETLSDGRETVYTQDGMIGLTDDGLFKMPNGKVVKEYSPMEGLILDFLNAKGNWGKVRENIEESIKRYREAGRAKDIEYYEKEKQLLDNPDIATWEYNSSIPSLYEVDIPENDVLLD